MSCFAGIDAGTQSLKVVVYDAANRQMVASVAEELPLDSRDDGVRVPVVVPGGVGRCLLLLEPLPLGSAQFLRLIGGRWSGRFGLTAVRAGFWSLGRRVRNRLLVSGISTFTSYYTFNGLTPEELVRLPSTR